MVVVFIVFYVIVLNDYIQESLEMKIMLIYSTYHYLFWLSLDTIDFQII